MGDAIVAEAEARHIDLIVMGRRGLGPLQQMFVGSNSLHVLESAHCPVMIVHLPQRRSYDQRRGMYTPPFERTNQKSENAVLDRWGKKKKRGVWPGGEKKKKKKKKKS